MRHDAVILIAAGDDERSLLIERTLFCAGVSNQTLRLVDGQAVLDFFAHLKDSDNPQSKLPWLLILDLDLRQADGLEVLKTIKSDCLLKLIPVIVLDASCSDDTASKYHEAGCNVFLATTADTDTLTGMFTGVGHFLSVIEIPVLRIQT